MNTSIWESTEILLNVHQKHSLKSQTCQNDERAMVCPKRQDCLNGLPFIFSLPLQLSPPWKIWGGTQSPANFQHELVTSACCKSVVLLRHWASAKACVSGCSVAHPCKALNRKMLAFHIKKQQPHFFVCFLIWPCDCHNNDVMVTLLKQ